MGAGKLIGRDVELSGLIEEDAQDGAEGIGLRSVSVGKIGECSEVVFAGQKFAVGRLAISPGSADFLGVVLERLGKVVVVDRADVSFIDAHPKGDGGADDGDLTGHEGILNLGPSFGAEARVIGTGREAFPLEKRGERFGSVLEGGVDDGRLNGGFLELFEEMLLAIFPRKGGDEELEIRAVEGELMVVIFSDLEVTANIGRNLWGGGGGEAEDPRDFELGREAGEFEIVGAKIVAPLGDAMGLINGEE